MKRWWVLLALVAVMCLWPVLGMAQDAGEEEGDFDEEAEALDADAGLGDEAITEEEVADAEQEPVDAPTRDAKGVSTYWGTENLKEVEKGFFLDLRIGPTLYIDGADLAADLGPGLTLQVGLGYDILDKLLALELNGVFSFYNQDVYTIDNATDTDFPLSSDFMGGGVNLAVNVKYFTTKRFEANIAPLGGFMMININDLDYDMFDASGSKVEQKADFFAGARLGIEYYTGLRHFSIGFDVEFDYYFTSKAMALSLYPMLKYTF